MFSVKQIIISGRERQLGFKKATDVAKTAFKLLFVASCTIQRNGSKVLLHWNW